MPSETPRRAVSGRSAEAAPTPRPIEAEFDGFGDRSGKFVRSLVTLSELRGELSSYAAEPNLRIVRTAFGKWALDLLGALAPRRRATFGELRKELRGISARVLSAKLKLLEEAGLVVRTVIPSRPPRPEYALTDRAHTLLKLSSKVLAYARSMGTPSRRAPVGTLAASAGPAKGEPLRPAPPA